MKIEINLNDEIKVQLTEHGEEILLKHYNWSEVIDKEGYRKFQLWDFINIYGKHIYHGSKQVIKNNIILITNSTQQRPLHKIT